MTFVLALSALRSTLGLAIVFFLVFPLLLHGLIGFAAAQSVGEHRENLEYLEGHEDTRA